MKIKHKIYRKNKNNTWTLNYEHPETLKRIRKSFKRKKHAEVYLEELRNKFIQDKELIYSDKTIEVVCKEYLNKFPNSTLVKTRYVFDFFLESFKNYIPSRIETKDLETCLLKLKKDNNLTQKSISNYKTQINYLFKYMLSTGQINTNPFDELSIKYKSSPELGNILSKNELDIILENLFYYSPFFLYRFIWLMLKADLSKIELCELKWEHVDFNQLKININNPRGSHIRSHHTDEEIYKFLQSLPKRSEYVLTNRLGKKIDRNLISRRILKFREQYPNTPRFDIDDIKRAAKHHKI